MAAKLAFQNELTWVGVFATQVSGAREGGTGGGTRLVAANLCIQLADKEAILQGQDFSRTDSGMHFFLHFYTGP